MEIADVNVAKKNKTKNIMKKNCPNGIFANTAGSTINSSPGPSVGLTPNAKIAGKIANPASTVIKTVKLTIDVADFAKCSSFFKYELYVTITEAPTVSEKKDCPIAYKTVSAVSFEKSGFKRTLLLQKHHQVLMHEQ